MARRSSEAWWNQHWGNPCHLQNPVYVSIGGHRFRTDRRMADAWAVFNQIIIRHAYEVHPPYPEGDSGMYNCRHIGSDPSRPMSVHSWGGAIDINWNSNPDGSRLVTDMPDPLRHDLHLIQTGSGQPVFRWGGDWDRDPSTPHGYYDAMHWEIIATPVELSTGVSTGSSSAAAPSSEEEDSMVELIRESYREANIDPRSVADDIVMWGMEILRKPTTEARLGGVNYVRGLLNLPPH